MAEAAAGDKGLAMEQKVRGMLPFPAQRPSGAVPVLGGSARVFIYPGALVLSPSAAGGGRGSCSLCLGGLFHLPLDRCRSEERPEGKASPRSHPGSECFLQTPFVPWVPSSRDLQPSSSSL